MCMKNIFVALFLVFAIGSTPAQTHTLLKFKISRPYCIFNFLESSIGAVGTSDALKQYIETNTKGDTTFQKLIEEYKSLNIEIVFQRQGFPETRPSYRSVKDLLIIAAVQSNNLSEFKKEIVGILHSSDYSRLIFLMEKADVFYERIIWKRYKNSAIKQLHELEKYQNAANDAFVKLKRFYNSAWSNEIPFLIALTPVPGKDGGTAATPHANVLCADVLTDETNYEGRIAIVLHEICHVLYAEQSPKTQFDLETAFTKNNSVFSDVAKSYFDEGLATACGNGWTYQLLTGKVDTAGWYSNPYIDGFGHAIFPLVSRYLSKNKTLDNDFVSEAIQLFGQTFPKAPYDYGIQLNHLTMYSDEEEVRLRNQIKQNLFEQYQVYWLNFSTPIIGTESMTFLKESSGTQFVIVDRNRDKVFETLKIILPKLNEITYNLEDDFVINYYDKLNRLIIISNIKEGETSKLFQALKKQQYMDPKNVYWKY